MADAEPPRIPNQPQPEQPPHFLPQITDDTRENMYYTLGVKSEGEEGWVNSFVEMSDLQKSSRAMAESVMRDLAAVNPHFVETITELARNSANDERYYMDMQAVGMATVLRAYHVNSDYALIDRMRNLTPHDIQQARTQWHELFKGAAAPTIFERALKAPRIPAEQVNLNQVVGRVAGAFGDLGNPQIHHGAAAMYEMLRQQWPKLNPSTPETPEAPPVE